jgi:hypothetical protein
MRRSSRITSSVISWKEDPNLRSGGISSVPKKKPAENFSMKKRAEPSLKSIGKELNVPNLPL